MKPSVLFIVSGDPRVSQRPAEAIRMAAGVSAWKKVEVRLHLRGPAVLALGEYTDELKDEDHYTRYLPILAEAGQPITVQAGAPDLGGLGESPVPFETLDDTGLAGLAARSSTVLHFHD